MTTVVGRIPLDHVATGVLVVRDQRADNLANYVVDFQFDIRCFRQSVLDGRRRIERVRIVVRQRERFRTRLDLQRSRQRGTVDGKVAIADLALHHLDEGTFDLHRGTED